MKTYRLATFIFSLAMASETFANPVLGNVAAGQVNIQQAPNSTVVNQSSQKAIINWQSFNIGAAEKTHFQQPAGGVALNRISPTQGASQIYGHLTATGKIILVNQAGIFFGPGSRVDVGGIIASTSDISDANFLAGKYQFDKASPYNGSIVNEGTIRAANHGLVALVGTGVRNDGTIQARSGNIILASGNKFTVDMYGDQLVNFTVDEAATSAAVDHRGKKLTDGVKNNGALLADGGTIIISARAARGVVDHVINMRGVAQARSVSQKNGVIILDGGDGNISVSGKINVSGKGKYARGGSVKILARNVHIKKSAVIDARGNAGGGEILIGGNYQGRGPEQNAYSTRVDKGAKINADAIQNGNGGRVIVWADHDTAFYGSISARGGIESGNGGFVETSGKKYLDVHGSTIDLRAPLGQTGTWLLDPENLTIQTTGPTTASFAANTYTSNVDNSILTVADLQTALASANIIVQTGAGGAQAGNITVADAITWNSAFGLTLNAINNIIINAAITAPNGGLALSAVNAANSITTGSAGAINVKDFTLSQGQWTQTLSSNPAFSVSNNFQLANGTRFIRNMGTVSILGVSHNVIADVFGLQGIHTQPLSNNYALSQDIDATVTQNWNSGAGFLPISSILTPFSGFFNGQNHTITNLYINRPLLQNVGLFRSKTGSSISNLGLINPDITGASLVGALAGLVNANVENSYVSGGAIYASGGYVGGLFGQSNGGVFSNLHNSSNITGGSYAGGIVGRNFGSTIMNSYNLGSVIGTETDAGSFGGIVGSNDGGSIQNSYNQGTISAIDSVGGIAGLNVGVIANSYNQGSIILFGDIEGVDGFKGGGIVGFNFGTIQRTYNQGSVSSLNTSEMGGIAGGNNGIILDSYNLGPVSGTFAVGGVVGQHFAGSITNTYNAGYVSSSTGSLLIGGLVGINSTSVTSSYWDTQTSGLSTSAGGGTPQTTAQLQSGLPAGFLPSTWSINTGTSYPYLSVLYPTMGRAVSGFIPGGSPTATGLANGAVQIAVNGTNLNTNALTLGNVTTGNNGYYYFIEPTGVIANNSALLAYLTDGNFANAVTRASTTGGDLTGLNMVTNTVTVGDSRTQTFNNTNALLDLAKGGLSSNILYSTTGTTNLILNPNVNLISSATTTYTLDGNITANGTGNVTFEGPVSVATGSHAVNAASGNIIFNNTLTGASGNLTLNGTSIFNAAITNLSSLTTNGPATINTATVSTLGSQYYNNTLTLGSTAVFTSDAGDISLTGTLIGGAQSLTLAGGAGGNHVFTLNDVSSLGTLIFSGNSSVTNTMDFSGYSAPITLTLSPPTGKELNSGILNLASINNASFTQIQQAIGTSDVQSKLFLPNVPNITVTYTNPAQTSGIIADPFIFIDFILQNPPIPTPTPIPNPTPGPSPFDINNSVISGTTALIINNKNMETFVDGVEQYENYFASSPWVNANISDIIKQQDATNQTQQMKLINCYSRMKNSTLNSTVDSTLNKCLFNSTDKIF